jgi:3-deoxy-D-manno-octulosonic acid kinase
VGEAILRGPAWAILHDPELIAAPRPELFDPASWRDGVQEHAGRGRGRVAFVSAGHRQFALRAYRRGGLIGRLVADRYLWFGESRTRSFREWRMLARLYAAGLPVPRPAAAAWWRQAAFYRAALASLRIPAAEPLSARLSAGEVVDWRAIGAVLRRFHDAGAWHADLNAHNILIDDSAGVWLLDFDRGRLLGPGSWREGNLARLERSLRKIAMEPEAPAFSHQGWRALRAGYEE